MPKDMTDLEPPRASLRDLIAVFAQVVAPTLGKGPPIRWPCVVDMAERLGLETNAVRVLARLGDR